MKAKIFLILVFFTITLLKAQTPVIIGPQVTTFSGWVRGYHFTSPTNFTLCALYIPQDASNGIQNISVVKFTAGAPPAFPGTTNAFTILLTATNVAANATVACNIPINTGDIIGVYGARTNACVNSYDGVNYVTPINGFNTTLSRSGMQSCLFGSTMNNIWSEVAYDIGRIFMFYNCCPTPTITASASPTAVCYGNSIVLSAGGAFTYTWSPGNISGMTATVTPTASTIYTATGTSTAGCTGTGTVAVTVNPTPTLVLAANPAAICLGQSTNLTANGAVTYTWNPGNITGASIVVSPTATTIYTATGTSAFGCIGTNTISVTVNPLPVVTPTNNGPVCLGGAINLGVSTFTAYSWSGPNAFSSTIQNPNIPNATLSMGGVYTVTVTNASGCKNTGTTNVIVNPLPVITPTNTGPYCSGQTINLSTSASTTYTWSGPNAFASNLQNPAIANGQVINSGVYTVTVTNAGGCISTGTTNVLVNQTPTAQPASNSSVCAGQVLNLTGLGGVTYTWSGPAAYNSTLQNPSITSASVTNSGTYSLTVTAANGCTNLATTNVLVNALPVIGVSNPTVCLNQTISLTSNGGVSYTWSGPLAYTSNLQNPIINSATLPMSGQYTVTVTSAAGCTNIAISNVTVYPLPTPGIIANTPLCAGKTLSLNGSGGATFSWSGPNGFSSNSQNPTINNVTLPAGGIYTLIVTAGTCSASTTASVTVNPLPVIAFSNTNVACNGGITGASSTSVTVGTGPFNYLWSNGQTVSLANNLPSGLYTCTVTDANGCVSTAVTQITQPTALNMSINANTLSACAGSNINLNGGITGGTGPGYTFTWSPGPISSAYLVSEINAGTYVYTLTGTDMNGCTVNKTISLIFHPQPTVTATSATLCTGDKGSLVAGGANTYVWSQGNVTGNTFTVIGIGNMNLTVIGTANGCTGQATAAIIVNPLPVVSLMAGNGKGCVPLCVTFTTQSSTGIQNVSWDFGDGSSSIGSTNNSARCYETSGNYKINSKVTDVNGCTSSITYSVEAYPKPEADFNFSPLKPIVNQDPEVTFTDASFGASIKTWDWYFMNLPKPHSNLQNPTYLYTDAGTFGVALVIKSDHGCTDTIVKTIIVGEDYGVFMPNAFTPNGDGINDMLQPKGFGISKYELRIFNRWGEELLFTNDFNQGWDGMWKGKLSAEGVYTWKINLTNVYGKSHELTGNVTLIK